MFMVMEKAHFNQLPALSIHISAAPLQQAQEHSTSQAFSLWFHWSGEKRAVYGQGKGMDEW